MLYMQACGFCLLTLVMPRLGGWGHLFDGSGWQPWAWGILAGVLNTSSTLALYRSFEIGKLSIVAPISACYPVLTMLLSALTGERLTPLRLCGLVLTILGVIFVARGEHEPDDANRGDNAAQPGKKGVGVRWALFSALCFGIMFWLLGLRVVPMLGSTPSVWLIRLTSVAATALVMLVARQSRALPLRPDMPLLLGLGMLDTSAYVFNNYGMGEDTLGNIGRSRIHTDDSIEIKYYDHPEKTLDKMAFSLTGDLGCEYGGGVSCLRNHPIKGTKGGPRQSFAGWMLYNRWWFKKDTFGLTIGGGAFDNPGRYLTLLQPINGADAVSGSPYFPASPGLPFKAWDTSITWDWMPKQYITFRWEYGYRHANQPYYSGRGGITPPGGNNGFPAQYACNDGTPGGSLLTSATCSSNGGVWFPDLRKDEPSIRLAIMVKF